MEFVGNSSRSDSSSSVRRLIDRYRVWEWQYQGLVKWQSMGD